jgi:hypothetical protein
MTNRVKQFFKEEKGRDAYFKEALSLFGEAPLKIGEIGCARNVKGRGGDGWSSFFWADYIKEFGGELHICDIDIQAIKFTKDSIPEDYNVTYYCMGGEGFIKENGPFDFVYLDGSNDPRETETQFHLIKNETDVILVDDWSIKGFISCDQKFENNFGEKFELLLLPLEYGTMGLISTPENLDKLENDNTCYLPTYEMLSYVSSKVAESTKDQ